MLIVLGLFMLDICMKKPVVHHAGLVYACVKKAIVNHAAGLAHAYVSPDRSRIGAALYPSHALVRRSLYLCIQEMSCSVHQKTRFPKLLLYGVEGEFRSMLNYYHPSLVAVLFFHAFSQKYSDD